MKLYEIANVAGPLEYVLYRVSSPSTDKVYYGYCSMPVAALEDQNRVDSLIKQAFLRNSEGDDTRGDVKMINAAGGKENLEFEALMSSVDPLEAWTERNNMRVSDGNSITGPTFFPAHMYNRAVSKDPSLALKWRARKISAVTAREAMGDEFKGVAKYTHADVKALVTSSKERRQIMHDLDHLLYPDFLRKYFPDRV